MEKYTSEHDTDEILDNVSIKSDDTDFLLSSDANDLLESMNNDTKMPDFGQLTITCKNETDIVEEIPFQGDRNDFNLTNNRNIDNIDRGYHVSEDNLDFVQRLRSGNEKRENGNNSEKSPNVLVNSMNDNELEEFGREKNDFTIHSNINYNVCLFSYLILERDCLFRVVAIWWIRNNIFYKGPVHCILFKGLQIQSICLLL